MSNIIYLLLVIGVIGYFLVELCSHLSRFFSRGRVHVDYTTFRERVERGVIASVSIDTQRSRLICIGQKGSQFEVTVPLIESTLIELLNTHRVRIMTLEKGSLRSTLFRYFIALVERLFWLALVGSLAAFMIQRLTLHEPPLKKTYEPVHETGSKRITFSDVAGCDEAKQELEEFIEYLKRPHRFKALGARIPKGALMSGPPGTGKTLLAKAVAGEAGVPFFSYSGSEFVQMYVGLGASRVRDLFAEVRQHAPCILFIDEFDTIGRKRFDGWQTHHEHDQTLNQLLVEMDGFADNEGVVVIAATNRVEVLDPAILRPGRFDRKIELTLPNLEGREAILKTHIQSKRIPIALTVDLREIARGTPGFSGADLDSLLNESALCAARARRGEVIQEDFEQARDRLLMGLKKNSILLSPHERESTAYHEAGHAIVNQLLKNTDPVHKVTILPRGGSLGMTAVLPIGERYSMDREYLENKIAMMYGGRCAELLIYGEKHVSTGARDDIHKATEIAQQMVRHWGLSNSPDLGTAHYANWELSEKTKVAIDTEVKAILERGAQCATALLAANSQILEAMKEALLLHETITSDQVKLLMQGLPLPVPDALAYGGLR